jgi:hypothetical protein
VANDAKTTQLQIRVSKREKSAIQGAAKRAGLDMSTYVLSRVLSAPAARFQELVEASAGPAPPFALAELNSIVIEAKWRRIARGGGGTANDRAHTVCCQLRSRDGGVRMRPPCDGPSRLEPFDLCRWPTPFLRVLCRASGFICSFAHLRRSGAATYSLIRA